MSPTTQKTAEEMLREQIIQDHTHNFFVEAGAGAGKTSLIISRIVEQLKRRIAPDRIVAITFTNKAAEELRFRILREVKVAGTTVPQLQNVLSHMGEMQISTIHSFCHRILSEHCFAAGLQPDFVLLEDAEAQKEPTAFFREWFAKCFVPLPKFPGVTLRNEIQYKDYLKNFLEICELPENTDFQYDGKGKAYLDLMQELQKAQTDYQTFLDDAVSKFMTKVAELRNAPDFASIPSCLLAAFATKELIGKNILSKYGQRIFKKVKIVPDPDGDSAVVWEYCKADILKLQELQQKISAQETCIQNKVILDVILPAWQEFGKIPQNRKLSNDKLLQRACQLLEQHPEVVEHLQKQYTCIYVDEFQDTDPIQKDLIYLLGQDKNKEFLPGMLFLVGDPKQSIYRFRNADYRLFYSVREDFTIHNQACKCCVLSDNHRSNENLIHFFNAMGPKIFQGGSITYSPMNPCKPTRNSSVLHGVYRLPVSGTWNAKNDSAALIQVIQSLIGKKSIFDHEEKAARPIRYSDFLVICQKARDMDIYVSAFHRAGIPVNVSVQYTPGDTAELRRFWLLFRALALPGYRRATAGWMEVSLEDSAAALDYNAIKKWRTQFRGQSAAAILGELTEHYEWYLYAHDPIPAHRAKRIQTALRQMTETLLSACPNNALSISNAMEQYIENAIDYQLSSAKNENCVRFFNQHKAKGLEGNIVIICQRKEGRTGNTHTENAGKTRYQTVNLHPPIFASFPAYGMNEPIRDQALQEDEAESARLAYVAVTRAKEVLIFLPPMEENDVFAAYANSDLVIEENLAAAPAVATAATDNAAEGEAVPSVAEVPLPAPEKAVPTASAGPHTPQCGAFEANIYPISPSLLEVHKPRVDASADTAAAAATAQSPALAASTAEDAEELAVLEDAEGPTSPVPAEPDELSAGRPKGNVFGTVMHRVFELTIQDLFAHTTPRTEVHIRRALLESNEDITAMFSDPVKARDDFAAYLRRILPDFQNFFQAELADTETLYTEYPFQISVSGTAADALLRQFDTSSKTVAKQLPTPAGGATPPLSISGKADLVLRKKDGTIVIWDYKSDTLHEGESPEAFRETIRSTYSNQMALYRWVFASLFSAPTVAGKFYSCEIGEVE